jgi:uncharacterized membrane protein YgcG
MSVYLSSSLPVLVDNKSSLKVIRSLYLVSAIICLVVMVVYLTNIAFYYFIINDRKNNTTSQPLTITDKKLKTLSISVIVISIFLIIPIILGFFLYAKFNITTKEISRQVVFLGDTLKKSQPTPQQLSGTSSIQAGLSNEAIDAASRIQHAIQNRQSFVTFSPQDIEILNQAKIQADRERELANFKVQQTNNIIKSIDDYKKQEEVIRTAERQQANIGGQLTGQLTTPELVPLPTGFSGAGYSRIPTGSTTNQPAQNYPPRPQAPPLNVPISAPPIESGGGGGGGYRGNNPSSGGGGQQSGFRSGGQSSQGNQQGGFDQRRRTTYINPKV